MKTHVTVSLVIVFVLCILGAWYTGDLITWMCVLGMGVGIGVAIDTLSPPNQVLGGGWWCFGPMNPPGNRCVLADGVGVSDKNVCETSCTLMSERQPTITNIRKFITDMGMVFPLNDKFLKKLPSDERFKRFKETQQYRYMVKLNNNPIIYTKVLKDAGVKFIGELSYLIIQKDSIYHDNLKSAIAKMTSDKDSVFSWWSSIDDLALNSLIELNNQVETDGESDDTLTWIMVLPYYRYLLTGEPRELSHNLNEWISNGFTGRSGIEVFFVDRLGRDAHRQVMVADHDNQILFYFEPNVGIGDTSLKIIYKSMFKVTKCPYKIVDLEWENCPRSFQAANRQDDMYCQTWSIFIAIVFALNYPKFNKEQIFGWMVNLGHHALDILIMFMYNIYVVNSSLVLTDELSVLTAKVTSNQLKLLNIDTEDLYTTESNAPRAVRDSIKPCRNIIRAIVDASNKAFGGMSDNSIVLDQVHYGDVIMDIYDVTVNNLMVKYHQMINDRSIVCNVGEFASIITTMIGRLRAKYMDVGNFGVKLSKYLTRALTLR